MEKLLGERLCSQVGWVSQISAVGRSRVLGWCLRQLLGPGMAAEGHSDHLWPARTVKFSHQKVYGPGFWGQTWALQACPSVRASADLLGRGIGRQALHKLHSLEPLALEEMA